jgi:hypothetical protein
VHCPIQYWVRGQCGKNYLYQDRLGTEKADEQYGRI